MATRARWGGLRPDPYNPNAFDADGDGIVQEGTAFERPAFTVIVDEFGNPLAENLRSDTRPQNWRIVDRNTGQEIAYTPSYELAPSQVISNQVGTIGGRVGTLKDMVGTIGDRVSTLEQTNGTIVSAPEVRSIEIDADFVSNVNEPTIEGPIVANNVPVLDSGFALDFENERLDVSNEMDKIKEEALSQIYSFVPRGWIEKLEFGGREVFIRSFPDQLDERDWFDVVEELVKKDPELGGSELDAILKNINDMRVAEDLNEVSGWTVTRIELPPDPFDDPFAPLDAQPVEDAPYTIEEARSLYMETLRRLSETRLNNIVKKIETEREESRASKTTQLARMTVAQELIEKRQRMLNPVDIRARTYEPETGNALVGQRNISAKEITNDVVGGRDVEQIQDQSDEVLIKAGDLTQSAYEDELTSLLSRDDITELLGEMTTDPTSNGQKLIERLISMRGLNGDVLKVSDDELDDMIATGYTEVTRGGSDYPNRQFLDGEMLIGTGVDGAGLYFATETFRPDGLLAVNPHFVAAEYARSSGTEGTVLRGVVNPSAKRVNIRRIQKELSAYRAHRDGTESELPDSKLYSLRERLAARAESGKDTEKTLKTLDSVLLAPYGETNHAIGFAAILMGFDAVGDGVESNRTLVYNRSALVMANRTLAPDEAEQTTGYENFKRRYNERLKMKGDLPLDPSEQEAEEWSQKRVQELVTAPIETPAVEPPSRTTPRTTTLSASAFKPPQIGSPKLSPGLPSQPANPEIALDNLLNTDLPDFSNFGIKRIDGQQIATGINDVVKNIESKYGEISTTGAAISSLRDSFPLLINDPFFLANDSAGVLSRSADDTLTQYEKGVVYGFLQLAIDVPEVSSFPISFEREQVGGSCDIVLFDSNGELFQPKPAIAFGVAMEENVAASSVALGIATRGESFSDIYDSVVSQSSLAYAYDNPEALPDAPSVLERSDFVSAISLALHESGHAADALAQLRDAFGEDATTDEIKEIISGDIAAQGFENIAKYRYAGRFKKIAETLNQRLPFLERMQSGLSKAETEMKEAFVETFGREPNETELARIEADAFNGLMFDDIESKVLSPFGDYYNIHFDSVESVAQETDPVTLTRKNVEFHLDRMNRQAEAIKDILNNPKYRPLVSDLDFEQFIITQGEREARAIGTVDPRAAMFWMYDSGAFMRTIDRHQDLINDFLEEYEGSTISELIRRDFQSDQAKLEIGFVYNLALSQMDDLSDDEIESVRDFGGMISDYGGDYSASFYNNIFMSAPVEAVAEIRAAIQSGRFPDKDTAEYKAVKKLFDWIYGLGFWEQMEFKYGR